MERRELSGYHDCQAVERVHDVPFQGSSRSDPLDNISTAESSSPSGFQRGPRLDERFGVGPADDRSRVRHRSDYRGEERRAGEAVRRAEYRQPLVGLVGYRLAEPERLPQVQPGIAGPVRHRIDSAAASIDGLARVADDDLLRSWLALDDRCYHWVGAENNR